MLHMDLCPSKGPSINQDIFVGQNSCNNIFFIIHSYTETSSQVRLVYLLSNFKLFLSNILQGSPEISRSFNDALTKKLFFPRSYVSYDFLIISSYTPIQIMVRREVFKIWYPDKDTHKTNIKTPIMYKGWGAVLTQQPMRTLVIFYRTHTKWRQDSTWSERKW